MILTQPEFKKKYYLSKTANAVQFDIIDGYIKDIKKLGNSNGSSGSSGTHGYLLTIYIKDPVILHEFDKNILDILVKNNNQWFKNDLCEDEIKQLYKPSVCSQSHTLNVILNDTSKVYINNKLQDTADFKLSASNAGFFRKCLMNLTIQHNGLYIHSKATYNKWVIKSLNIYNDDEFIEDIDDSKEDIEESWKMMMSECNDILNNKIKIIQSTQNKLETLYSEVVSEKNKGRSWEAKISQLKNLIQNIIF